MTRLTMRGSRQQRIHPILRFFCGQPAMNRREAGNSSLWMGDAATSLGTHPPHFPLLPKENDRFDDFGLPTRAGGRRSSDAGRILV